VVENPMRGSCVGEDACASRRGIRVVLCGVGVQPAGVTLAARRPLAEAIGEARQTLPGFAAGDGGSPDSGACFR
jgi:hypothetical protein